MHVYMEGELITQHCITANAPTYEGDEWVTMDIVARADGNLAHVIAGDTVIQYQNPMMGGDMVHNLMEGSERNETVNGGYIALQSESHPISLKSTDQILKD